MPCYRVRLHTTIAPGADQAAGGSCLGRSQYSWAFSDKNRAISSRDHRLRPDLAVPSSCFVLIGRIDRARLLSLVFVAVLHALAWASLSPMGCEDGACVASSRSANTSRVACRFVMPHLCLRQKSPTHNIHSWHIATSPHPV